MEDLRGQGEDRQAGVDVNMAGIIVNTATVIQGQSRIIVTLLAF